MHGQEKQPGGSLTDIVNVKIFGHRRRHGELAQNKKKSASQLFCFLCMKHNKKNHFQD